MENNMIAIVNPITKDATILHKVGQVLHEIKLGFESLDEWNGFETDKQYDVHFYYDDYFNFYITEYKEDKPYGDVNYTLIVEYNEEDFNLAVMNNSLKLQDNGN